MQEIIYELFIIWQLHKKIVKGQSQDFQIELEYVRGKLGKLESRSKLLENKVKALKFLRKQISQKTSLTKTILLSSGGTQKKREKRYISEPKSPGGSQVQHWIIMPIIKANTPNQLKKIQSDV